MDFGSLDFGTWQLVGFCLLGVGALAAVFAVVAIIVMFRGGKTNVSEKRANADQDDDDDYYDDDHDQDDESRDDDSSEDDVDSGDDVGPYRSIRRTEDAAAARIRSQDNGPAAPPVGPGNFTESLFAEPTNVLPRQPIPSTRDEPHVPSPDWYEYPDVVDPERAVDDGGALLAPIAKDHRPEAPPAPAAPPPASATKERSAFPAQQEPQRPAGGWFDDVENAGEVSPTPPARQSEMPATPPPAVQPANFPWAQATPSATAAPEQAPAAEREEPQRLRGEWYDQPEDSDPAQAAPTAPARHSETRPAVPNTAVPNPRPEPGPVDVTSNAPARHSETRPAVPTTAVPNTPVPNTPAPTTAVPDLPVRQDPDSPTADWYDDPDGSGGERWWDGTGWTKHRRPRGDPRATDAGRPGTVAAGPLAAEPGLGDSRQAAPATTQTDTQQDGQPAPRPPGWYRDPSGSGGRRFWDGSEWTSGS